MADNTIFDDTFHTMIQKMPQLVLPLINEVFQTSYPEDAGIIQLRNEHHDTKSGEVITDTCLQIGTFLYHVECQSTDDSTMAVRMIEYDFRIALEHAQKDGRRYRICLPRACVIYLRDTAATPDCLEADLVSMDGQVLDYRIPTLKVSRYTTEAIFEKRLLMLLPFYVMRYENPSRSLAHDPNTQRRLFSDLTDICTRLNREPDIEKRFLMYMDLKQLIIKIADYIFSQDAKTQEGIGDIMGGKILELESERLLRLGREEGRQEGREDIRQLVNALHADGRFGDIMRAMNDQAFQNALFVHYGIRR